jgi:acetylornithine deacetylase/succinyl-diaminopimelate desuccinylase-like protein
MKRFGQVLTGAVAIGALMSGMAQAQAVSGTGLSARAQDAAKGTRPDQVAFRALYKELVETDTSITTGSCTLLADKVEKHLREAGYGDAQITRYAVPDHPKEGGLVVVLPGSSKVLKPLLLLGHLDVVVAKREDWTRDPYTLIEENGYFYGRGTSDMKAMDATWIDLMMRWKKEGYTPKRTVKLALTCGEETSWAFNGANWLANNKRELIDAEFALNEGGGGRTDGHGNVVQQSLHVGEKFAVNYQIVATNPGGHSSIPVRDNAIYEVAEALLKVRDYEFPLMLTDTTKAYFGKLGAARTDAMGAAMRTIASTPIGSPESRAAEAVLNTDRSFHSMLRTTCVATLIDGGHANNALPQHAGANINCRVFPGVSVESVQDKLKEIIADPHLTLTMETLRGPVAKAPPLTPQVLGPVERQMAVYFPGVPLVPTMSTGATDGIFLEAVGIPSYGPPGGFGDPDGGGVHGLNERRSVASLYIGRDFLDDLVKDYANH